MSLRRNYVTDRMALEAKLSKEQLKNKIIRQLKSNGFRVTDCFYNKTYWVIEYEEH